MPKIEVTVNANLAVVASITSKVLKLRQWTTAKEQLIAINTLEAAARFLQTTQASEEDDLFMELSHDVSNYPTYETAFFALVELGKADLPTKHEREIHQADFREYLVTIQQLRAALLQVQTELPSETSIDAVAEFFQKVMRVAQQAMANFAHSGCVVDI